MQLQLVLSKPFSRSTYTTPFLQTNFHKNFRKSITIHSRIILKSLITKVSSDDYQSSDDLGFEGNPINDSDDKVGASSIDFLELEKEKMENARSSESVKKEEKILNVEDLDSSAGSKSEELGEFVGKVGLRSGRQLMRRSNMIAKQVIGIESAISLGFVSQLWVDTTSWVVLVVEARPSLLSGEIERFYLEEVCRVGDFVLIEDESVMENGLQMIGLETLVGYNVITQSRRSIGKVRGYTFNINSGSLELLELDSFGISVIPSSLVSTYALFVEDVIEVISDTVVVHEEAASRLQRLTKGFWDTPNVETYSDEFEEYPEFERRPARSDNSRRNHKSFRKKTSASRPRPPEDELDLPMDYL
ncbi:hypothetical protein MKW94_020165 [Papaver nudicaule]|uniref:PRC-barrel domain-containing protein n=1 Tax=Papaver nudicaule TaxID=74823 RepID=A0AA41S073_PAPNU|nr:hypothetical protein [Papaver nudicaule]